eukprot:522717-Pelagomonas_calceolata.AAC.1
MTTFWERAYKASGSSKADCMFFIVEDARAGRKVQVHLSQPSNIVEGFAAWANARDTGISQIVIFEASL